MVENRPILDLIGHLILIAGVAVVILPVYIAIIASTHGNTDFMSGLIPLLPGDQAVTNYSHMLGEAFRRRARRRSGRCCSTA
jgi:sn-glycerol 3-phosphate transport system permease protein